MARGPEAIKVRMRTPLSLLEQQLKGPRREIDFVNQAKYFLQGVVCGLRTQVGKIAFANW